jgi:hypothetical protein
MDSGLPLADGAVIVASSGQLSCDLGGEAAILSMKDGLYYGLNAVGARIWELLQMPRRVAEIRDALVEEYAVGPEQCEQDLRELLERLAVAGLIEIRAETTA